MATLTAGISASATLLPVSAEVAIGFYTIDSENIYVTGMSRGADGRAFTRRTASVDRAVGGSTAATHLSAATLTRYYPDAASAGGGGGGVEVNSTPVTNIVAANATIDGDEATVVTLPPGWSFDVDGRLVIDTEVALPTSKIVFMGADAAETLELGGGILAVSTPEGDTVLYADSTLVEVDLNTADGDINLHLKEEDGANDRHYRLLMGSNRIELSYVDPAADSPDNAVTLAQAGITIGTTDPASALGFYGTVPVVRPEIPASPTEQDIADVLVALGLVTQAAP